MSDEISDEIVDSLIKTILDSIIITDEGTVQWKGAERIFTIQRDIDILISFLQEKTDFLRKLKTKRYSFSPESSLLYGFEFVDIFKSLKSDKRTSFEEFKIEFNNKINEIAKIPQKEFTLIYPLNFEFVKNVDFEINKDKIEIISFEDFTTRFLDIQQKIQEAKADGDIKTEFRFRLLKGVCNKKFSFFVIKVYARNDFFAIEYATERLSYVLGLLTLAKYFRHASITIAGRATKLSKLSLSKVLIFEKTELINFADFNEQIVSFEEIDEDNIGTFSEILESYNNIKYPSIVEILESALTSYYEASIDEYMAYSFLKYWICIEFCLLKSEGITENEIIKRLKSMVIPEDEYLKFRLDWLYKKRNNLVHKLDMNISQNERNLAKSISEALINFLLSNGNRFSNKNELNLFYKFIQEDNESLTTDKKVIYLIKEFRKNLKGTKIE